MGEYTLWEAFERACSYEYEGLAVDCLEGRFTYPELLDRVSRLASGLLSQHHIEPGSRIAVMAANCHRYLELYWAAVRLGALVVPINTRLNAAEIAYILGECRPSLFVADGDDHRWPAMDIPVMGWAEHERFIVESAPYQGPCQPLEQPVAIFYTAAVDGKPQGAVITGRNLLAQSLQMGSRLGLSSRDSYGNFLPLFHMFGACFSVMSCCFGAVNVMSRLFDASAAAALVRAGKVTFFSEFAPMAQRLGGALGWDSGAVGRLRLVVGIDSPEIIQRYVQMGVRWLNLYGQTEIAGLATMGEVSASGSEVGYVGEPLCLTWMSVRNPMGDPVLPGAAGELWIRGPVVERYWPDRPTRMTEDGWLKTGDVLKCQKGHWIFVSRTNDKYLIKSGGENVYPAEVEQVLCAHPEVIKACVVGRDDPVWKERVCAAVVMVPKATASPADLAEFCRERIAAFKVPREFMVMDRIPQRNETFDREAVRDLMARSPTIGTSKGA